MLQILYDGSMIKDIKCTLVVIATYQCLNNVADTLRRLKDKGYKLCIGCHGHTNDCPFVKVCKNKAVSRTYNKQAQSLFSILSTVKMIYFPLKHFYSFLVCVQNTDCGYTLEFGQK